MPACERSLPRRPRTGSASCFGPPSRGPCASPGTARRGAWVLSVEQFERLRGTAWDRLVAEMDAMSQEAAANGLTPAVLESLLSDES